MSEDWYSTGFSNTEMAVKQAGESREQSKVQRWFLKAQQDKSLVFVDDTAFEIWEHQLKINDTWGHHFTCVGQKNGCPICRKYKPYYVSMFTVIDVNGWVDKKGVVRDKGRPMLFSAKADVALIIKRQKELRPSKTLVACEFNVMRISSDDFSTGSQFTFLKQYDIEKLKAKHKAFNYIEMLKPWSVDRMEALMSDLGHGKSGSAKAAQAQPTNSAGVDYSSGSGKEDDIPF